MQLSCRYVKAYYYDIKANIHTATPHTTKLSILCRVRFDGVNWIPDISRLSPIENMKSAHVPSNGPVTPSHQTRHRQDRLVVSGVAV